MQLAGAPALAPLRTARAAQPRRSSVATHAAASKKKKPQVQEAPSRGRPMQKAPPPAPTQQAPPPEAPTANLYPPPPAVARATPPPPSFVRAAPPPPPVEEPISSAEALPQVVSDRILGRIVTFSGLPLLLGFASGPLAYYYKVSGQGELPKELLYTSGTLVFALAAAGISYGVLSASWDPRKPGSALGIEEFQSNLPIILDKVFKKNK